MAATSGKPENAEAPLIPIFSSTPQDIEQWSINTLVESVIWIPSGSQVGGVGSCRFAPVRIREVDDAQYINQVGFDPQDPVKRAYVGCINAPNNRFKRPSNLLAFIKRNWRANRSAPSMVLGKRIIDSNLELPIVPRFKYVLVNAAAIVGSRTSWLE